METLIIYDATAFFNALGKITFQSFVNNYVIIHRHYSFLGLQYRIYYSHLSKKQFFKFTIGNIIYNQSNP